MNRLLSIPLAATLSLVLPAGSAYAVSTYDARTLGMGGSSVGYSGNASLAYWNPAAVGMSRNVGVFLPTLSFSLSNNLLSPADAQTLAGSFSKLGQTGSASGNTDFTQIFTNLGSSQGLNLQAEALVEPIGLALGRVGPGSMAFRLYGHAVANAHVNLSSDFATNLNGLFFNGGFTNISTAVNALTKDASNPTLAGGQAGLKADVDTLKGLLDLNMSSFIKNGGAKTTTKVLSLNESVGADATAAFTYAQILPFRFIAMPKSEVSVGATAKIFGSPGTALAGVGQFALPGGTGGEKVSPLGGGAGAEINLNIDKQVTDLRNAISNFEDNQNIATTADIASKAGAFFSDGLSNSSVQFSSLTPDNVGAGLDLGTVVKFDDQLSIGLSLINPIMIWKATKSTYKYDFSGDGIRLLKANPDERVNFSAAEPFVVRAGGAFQPILPGPPALAKGLMINAGVEAPVNNGVPASIQFGVEKTFFDVFAIRLGTSQLGISPLYTAGLGVQSRYFQLNLGAGVDSPSNKLKALALALTLGAGF